MLVPFPSRHDANTYLATMESHYSVNTVRNVPEWERTLWVARVDPLVVRWPRASSFAAHVCQMRGRTRQQCSHIAVIAHVHRNSNSAESRK